MARQTQKDNKKSGTRVQDVNGFVLFIVYYAIRLYTLLCGIRVKSVNKVGDVPAPAIILCNHGSFMDFIYASKLLRQYKPHFVVARLYFYNNVLGWLLRTVGAFPKSMFTIDLESAINCLSVLRKKQILAMMPEARLSTAGRFEDIQPGTYSFIQKAGVPVYTVTFNGDYLADPKWGKGFRRGSVVEVELDILYTAEQVASLTEEQIRQGVEERLYYDEFAWLAQRPRIRYRCRKMAEGLENILSICPVCGGRHTITTKKNKVFCEHCGYLTSMDRRYGFTDHFRFQNLLQWYDWQKAQLADEIAATPDYTLTSAVELRLPTADGKGLTRHAGDGVCTLTRDGLTYVGTKDGEEVQLHFPLQRIYRLLFGAGKNFEIYDGTQIQFFVPSDTRSAVDWYMASTILYDEVVTTHP